MKLKKFFVVMLVVAFVLTSVIGVVTGLGASSSKLPYVKLTWYVIGTPQKDWDLINQKVNEYIKPKLNAEIKMTMFDWGEYNDKLQTKIAAGEPFDICFTAIWTNNYRTNVAKGAFLPLNKPGKDLLSKYAPKTKKLLGDDFIKGASINGILYAIPANKEKAHNWGFIVRMDLVKKYKLDDMFKKVKKLEDLEPYLKIIKQKEPGIYPLGAYAGESPRFLLDWDKVVDDDVPVSLYPNNKSTKIINELEQPNTKALFKTVRKYYLAGYIRKDAASVTDWMSDLKAGKVFVMPQSLKPGKDAEMSISTGYQWKQIDITPPVMSTRECIGSMQAINAKSKNPERALMFLELFNTDKYLNNLVNFGIEGQHYVFKDKAKGIIAPGPKAKDYSPGLGWMFGNQFINYIYENEDPNKWKNFEEYNKKALPLLSLGFNFDDSKVKTQVAACKSVWKQYIPMLETGSVDPDKYIPQAIEKFKRAGVDIIIKEAQKQYDDFLKKTGRKK